MNFYQVSRLDFLLFPVIDFLSPHISSVFGVSPSDFFAAKEGASDPPPPPLLALSRVVEFRSHITDPTGVPRKSLTPGIIRATLHFDQSVMDEKYTIFKSMQHSKSH